MSGILESVKNFFVLGSLDCVNKFKLLGIGFQERKKAKKIEELIRTVGRESWELGIANTGDFPSAEKLKEFEALLKEKKAGLQDVESEQEKLQEQKITLQEHYKKKLDEQTQMKFPVDEELTDITVETKRVRKEIRGSHIEIKTLQNKLTVLQSRFEDFQKQKQEATHYLKEEILAEINLNKRFMELKRENVKLLETNIKKCTTKAEKVQIVIRQFDEQIAEIKSSERDMIARHKNEIFKKQEAKTALHSQIKRINENMNPVLHSFGSEVTTRRVASKKLVEHYKRIDILETAREDLQDSAASLRRECASIGPGVKIGFYSFSVAVLCAFALLVAISV